MGDGLFLAQPVCSTGDAAFGFVFPRRRDRTPPDGPTDPGRRGTALIASSPCVSLGPIPTRHRPMREARTMNRRGSRVAAILSLTLACAAPAFAQGGPASSDWKPLFDGKSLDGWEHV